MGIESGSVAFVSPALSPRSSVHMAESLAASPGMPLAMQHLGAEPSTAIFDRPTFGAAVAVVTAIGAVCYKRREAKRNRPSRVGMQIWGFLSKDKEETETESPQSPDPHSVETEAPATEHRSLSELLMDNVNGVTKQITVSSDSSTEVASSIKEQAPLTHEDEEDIEKSTEIEDSALKTEEVPIEEDVLAESKEEEVTKPQSEALDPTAIEEQAPTSEGLQTTKEDQKAVVSVSVDSKPVEVHDKEESPAVVSEHAPTSEGLQTTKEDQKAAVSVSVDSKPIEVHDKEESPAAVSPSSFYDVLKESRGVPLTFDGSRAQQETAQDRVFHWLGRGPQPRSDLFQSLHQYFPGAMPGSAVHLRSTSILETEFGLTPSNTLLGTSFCPDEINHQGVDIATVARKHWGNVFPMGGIGGSPYVGETGFAAFSSHVADDGNIIVVFGPHVGISEAGEIGKYLREGQNENSSACGAVIGAYGACQSGDLDSVKEGEEEYDMQMDEIKAEFSPHAKAISTSENPMASCAYQAWEMVKDRMLKIVNTKFGCGKLVLIGGIQINMPYPACEDYFLPMLFELRQEGQPSKDLMHHFADSSTQQDLARAPWAATTAQSEVFAWLSWSPPSVSPLFQTMQRYFPGALPGQAVHQRTLRIMERFGITKENTILGTSLCPDEINNDSRDLPVLMQTYWGEVFPMGGISGAPFAGKTGFGAFSSHVAENGNILIMFGPHVAISESGEVGYCLRDGQKKESTACGAVIGAYKACSEGWSPSPAASGAYDLQMDWIKAQIAPHAREISASENPMASLAYQSYEMVKEKIFSVVNNDFGGGYLVLLGGIQINCPNTVEDHFLPCTLEIRRAGDAPLDVLREMKNFG